MRTACSLAFALLVFSPLALAQPAGIVVTGSPERNEILLGDRFEFTVTAEHGPDYAVALPVQPDVSPFTLLTVPPVEMEKQGGRVVDTARYTLSIYETGEFQVPPIAAEFTTPEGVTGTISTAPVVITVGGVGADAEGAELQDIAPPIAFGGITLFQVLVVLGILLLVAGLIAWIMLRGKKTRPVVEQPVPKIPAGVRARQRLDAVRDGDMIPRDRRREFATEVSEILREYLDGRFGMGAVHMTTWEILEACRAHDGTAAHTERVNAIQRGCDLVKFARYEPPAEEMRETLAHAYALVEATEPRLAEAAS